MSPEGRALHSAPGAMPEGQGQRPKKGAQAFGILGASRGLREAGTAGGGEQAPGEGTFTPMSPKGRGTVGRSKGDASRARAAQGAQVTCRSGEGGETGEDAGVEG